MRKLFALYLALAFVFALNTAPVLAEASGGGTRCDCDGCCRDSYTNKCYFCGPPPPAEVALVDIFAAGAVEKLAQQLGVGDEPSLVCSAP